MKRVALSFAAFVVTLGSAARVFAGDTSDLQGLLDETVVTTASKSAETATNAPATSTTLTADDMRRYGIRTIDEAINFLSLGASAYNPLYRPDVGARGVSIDGDRGAHVLLLVDGHSMNDVATGGARVGRGLGVPH
jgi:outer membrane receptor for ferrienterochelin and colicin